MDVNTYGVYVFKDKCEDKSNLSCIYKGTDLKSALMVILEQIRYPGVAYEIIGRTLIWGGVIWNLGIPSDDGTGCDKLLVKILNGDELSEKLNAWTSQST